MIVVAGIFLLLYPAALCLLGWKTLFGGIPVAWLTGFIAIIFLVFTAFLVSFLNPGSKTDGRRSIAFVLPFISVNILAMIVLFAEIYQRTGLANSGNPQPVGNAWSCVYFSVVTWTTLGYGDIVPFGPASRAFAAAEALLGYVVMGLMIAALVNILRPRS